MNKIKTLKKIKEDLKSRITEGYFIYCKPMKKPDFKILSEAEAWYRSQNYIAEKIVGSWVDSVMVVLEQALHTQRREIENMIIEKKNMYLGELTDYKIDDVLDDILTNLQEDNE